MYGGYFCWTTPSVTPETDKERKERLMKEALEKKKRQEEDEKFRKMCIKYSVIWVWALILIILFPLLVYSRTLI